MAVGPTTFSTILGSLGAASSIIQSGLPTQKAFGIFAPFLDGWSQVKDLHSVVDPINRIVKRFSGTPDGYVSHLDALEAVKESFEQTVQLIKQNTQPLKVDGSLAGLEVLVTNTRSAVYYPLNKLLEVSTVGDRAGIGASSVYETPKRWGVSSRNQDADLELRIAQVRNEHIEGRAASISKESRRILATALAHLEDALKLADIPEVRQRISEARRHIIENEHTIRRFQELHLEDESSVQQGHAVETPLDVVSFKLSVSESVRILVFDDREQRINGVKKVLKDIEHEKVYFAQDFSDAINIFHEQDINLVIVGAKVGDWRGLDVVGLLRQKNPNLAVLLLADEIPGTTLPPEENRVAYLREAISDRTHVKVVGTLIRLFS